MTTKIESENVKRTVHLPQKVLTVGEVCALLDYRNFSSYVASLIAADARIRGVDIGEKNRKSAANKAA
jgi:hypothetical protein